MYEDQIERALGVYEHKQNVRDHFYCVKSIFDLYKSQEQLEKLAQRPDVDTICAFDHFRMKQHVLNDGLTYQDFNPEIKGIKIPKME
mmetsp:Transcript_25225/g.39050  ORF Transcript_25225/g.39050 Transcript_25225/m.39050 type:complete len:87 (+) Transcript_25225:25-285(+)|eukprot:CAMPEP_0170496476 /NCGR_PEP_ID=MMETSP0208-20121228/21720_1 /TAXON_ID=197538 /ORGANISM="Strombidium inclinatum, Strain S3" /LENGTH=86 /DNA_ID=CAMNT_0010773031 /DNA_START=13 /DNA_END=273 /DNA_ORIENTATION=-